MRNRDVEVLILMIIFIVVIPFCVSMWGFLTSELLEDFISIILSDNKILGSLVLSFMWIAGIGKVSEFVRLKKEQTTLFKRSRLG